jgi:hypothetical protein
MFKLEVVDFVKEKGNREAATKFIVRETCIRERRKEEVTVTYVKKWVLKSFRRYFNARNRR